MVDLYHDGTGGVTEIVFVIAAGHTLHDMARQHHRRIVPGFEGLGHGIGLDAGRGPLETAGSLSRALEAALGGHGGESKSKNHHTRKQQTHGISPSGGMAAIRNSCGWGHGRSPALADWALSASPHCACGCQQSVSTGRKNACVMDNFCYYIDFTE